MEQLPLSKRAKGAVRQPKEECSFSIDINSKVHVDDRCMSYFYMPDIQLDYTLDLKGGYKQFLRKDESVDQHLDPLLTAIMQREKESGKKVKADIISFRGVMTKLLILPYESGDDIDLNLVLFDGQIFMEEDNKLSQSKKRTMDERGDMMCYWGYKFEALATLDKPWAEVDRSTIMNRHQNRVNNIEQYCAVVRSGAGKVKTIIGGEVDCVYDFKPPHGDPLPHYVELKTSQVIQNENDMRKFDRKLLKTWAQSFLLGLRKVIYGFRDQDGIVKSIEEYQVEQIPNMVKQSKYTNKDKKWNGNDAISWYAAVLEWIKETVTEGAAWRLQYQAGSKNLQLFQLDGDENERVKDFLLPEFVQWRKELS